METLNQLLSIDFNYFLIGLIVVFYTLEQLVATQFTVKKRPQHLLNNIMFQVVFIIINIAWAAITIFSIEWLNKHEAGLFYYVQVPYWLKLALGVVMFDFTNYWFHRAAHKLPVVWRAHRVHHSDSTMDTSTYFRGHPLEVFLWFGVSNIVAAGLFGLDGTALGLFFLVSLPFLVIEHSNLRFPTWPDKTIGLVFTTPNLHKIHHDRDQYYTDSNYSDVFILWDRLFGTFKYKPVDQIKLGLPEFDNDKKQTFWYLLASPFFNLKRLENESQNPGKPNQVLLKRSKQKGVFAE